MIDDRKLKEVDYELAKAIEDETRRQQEHIELIASENYVSEAVLEAQGSIMTNKYAEGYPGHRYYGGCEYVDVAENLARDRLKKLFSAAYVNVQPHSGSEANLAVPLIIAFQSTSFTEERSAFSSAFHNRAFLKGISGKRKT